MLLVQSKNYITMKRFIRYAEPKVQRLGTGLLAQV